MKKYYDSVWLAAASFKSYDFESISSTFKGSFVSFWVGKENEEI